MTTLVILFIVIVLILVTTWASLRIIEERAGERFDMDFVPGLQKMVFDVLSLKEEVKMVNLWDPEVDRIFPVAYALVSVNSQHCNLWFIYTNENRRRRGYGRRIIEMLLKEYGTIRTEYLQATINSDGSEFCRKCGFKEKRPMFKKDAGEFVLSKEEYRGR